MSTVSRKDIDNCTILTLNRPEVCNAINGALVNEFEQHLDAVESEKTARALIIEGSGKGFCAGTDLREMTDIGYAAYAQRIDRMHQLLQRIETFYCPTIAALHGAVLGGGLELAMACTFRIASLTTNIGLPEILLGVMPSYGGTQRLTRLVGQSQALDLLLTGRSIDAPAALNMGLVNRLAEHELTTAALAFAAEFKGFSRVAQQGIRHAVAAACEDPEKGFAEERRQCDQVFNSKDACEGVAAFLEKRRAVFRDC